MHREKKKGFTTCRVDAERIECENENKEQRLYQYTYIIRATISVEMLRKRMLYDANSIKNRIHSFSFIAFVQFL